MSQQETERGLQLPDEVLSRVEARVPHTEFDSASEYVTYVLEATLSHVEAVNDLEDGQEVDEQQVQEQLKSLGYLNE